VEIGLVNAKLGGGASSQTKSAMTYDAKTNRVYTGTARKVLFAFNPDTGAVSWRTQDPVAQFLHTPSAPVVGEGVVVGSSFWMGLFGYDEKTGKELWRHTRNNSVVTKEWYKSGLPWIERFGFPVFKDGKLYLSHDAESDPAEQEGTEFSVNAKTLTLKLQGKDVPDFLKELVFKRVG
jgi:outer membrane protein assembly factor BamB